MRLFFFLTLILFLSACVETVSTKSTSNTIAQKPQEKRGLTRIKPIPNSNSQKKALVKKALIIGNSRYEYRPLQNTLNDANDLAQVLTELGFQVILKTNLNQKEMDRALKEFGQRVKDYQGIGLFYFSGHGASVEGQNYLIPIDNNRIQEATDLKYYAIDTDKVLNTMETGNNHLNVVILDACRDNPYQSQGKSLSRGLSQMQSVSSSIIAFATSPGKTASDASLGGRNGLYTKYLIDGLKKAHKNRQRIDDMFMQVTKAVVEESGGEQKPWYSASLMDPFCFGGCQITIQSTTTMQVYPYPKQEHSAPPTPAIPPPAPVPITPPPAPVPSTPPPAPVTTTPSPAAVSIADTITKEDMESIFYGFIDAWNNKQHRRLISYLAPDFYDFTDGKATFYQEYVAGKKRLFRKNRWISVEVSNVKYSFKGNKGTVTYYQHFNSPSYESWGTNRFYFRKKGGQTKIFKEEFLHRERFRRKGSR